jgi:hypothetical protein
MNWFEKWLTKETPDGPKPDMWKIACLLLAVVALMLLLLGGRGGEKHTTEKIEIRSSTEKSKDSDKSKVHVRPKEDALLAKSIHPRKEAKAAFAPGDAGSPAPPPVREEVREAQMVTEKKPVTFQIPKDAQISVSELNKAVEAMKANAFQPQPYSPPRLLTNPMPYEIQTVGWQSITPERKALAVAACRDELQALHRLCTTAQEDAKRYEYCAYGRNRIRLMAQLKTKLEAACEVLTKSGESGSLDADPTKYLALEREVLGWLKRK